MTVIRVTDAMVAGALSAFTTIDTVGTYSPEARTAVLDGFRPWILQRVSANELSVTIGKAVKTSQGKMVAPGNKALRYRWATLHVKAESMPESTPGQQEARKSASEFLAESDKMSDADLRSLLADAREDLVTWGLARETGRRKAEVSFAEASASLVVSAMKRLTRAGKTPVKSGKRTLPPFNATALAIMYLAEGITDAKKLAASYVSAEKPQPVAVQPAEVPIIPIPAEKPRAARKPRAAKVA